MGIGAILGGGVDAYQNAAEIARRQSWEDEQRAEVRRQQGLDVARDQAGQQAAAAAQAAAQDTGDQVVDGSAINKLAPGLDPNNANNLATFIKNNPGVDPTQIIKGLATSGAGVRPTASDVGTGLPVAMPSQAAPQQDWQKDGGFDTSKVTPEQLQALQKTPGFDPKALRQGLDSQKINTGDMSSSVNAPARDTTLDDLRTYHGADGQVHMTTKTARDAKPSEILGATAKRYLSLGDAKSMDMGSKLMKMAGDTMAQEAEQDVNSIMSDKNLDTAGKMGKLAGLIGDNSFIPGETKLALNAKGDGMVLQSQVPGQSAPHTFPIKGATPDEALQNLAQTVRSMHSPELALKLQEHNLKQQTQNDTREHQQGDINVRNRAADLADTMAGSEIRLRQAQTNSADAQSGYYGAHAAQVKAATDQLTMATQGMKDAEPLVAQFKALSPEDKYGDKGMGLLRDIELTSAKASPDVGRIVSGMVNEMKADALQTRADKAGTNGKVQPTVVMGTGDYAGVAYDAVTKKPLYHIDQESKAQIPIGMTPQQYKDAKASADAAKVPFMEGMVNGKWRVGFQGADGQTYDNPKQAKDAKPAPVKAKAGIDASAAPPAPAPVAPAAAAPSVGTGLSSDITVTTETRGRRGKVPVYTLPNGMSFDTMAEAQAMLQKQQGMVDAYKNMK